jgi:cysteinyl-tRNA synthetase
VKIFNTLTRKKEDFVPLAPGEVRMYVCGVTPYDYSHVGHARSAMVFDVIRRYLTFRGFRVTMVRNYTDVDDKIIRRANGEGVTAREIAERYIAAEIEDMASLGVTAPEVAPKATEHVPGMVALIERLIANEIAYVVDGDVYFEIRRFPPYGRLSGKNLDDLLAGARVEVDERKRDPRDFALWKAAKPGEPSWPSPWGPGRPGWHIECSVMAMEYLGDTLDIHTGGVDLVFPHHENEIAQSEGITGKPFVRYWLHAEHLLVDGQKMSKSLGNFYTLRDLLEKGYSPDAVRYLLASVPYRKQLNFTFDALKSANTAIERLRNFKLRLETDRFEPGENPKLTTMGSEAQQQLEAGMDDDLNTARALAAIFDYVRDTNTAMDAGEFKAGNLAGARDLLSRFDSIFAVLKSSERSRLSPDEIQQAIDARLAARKARDFARADQIRKDLAEQGVILEDTKEGTRWKYS